MQTWPRLDREPRRFTGGKLEDLLEVPVRPDGTFEFGHVPPGKYLVSLYPPTPGIASMPITVANDDISGRRTCSAAHEEGHRPDHRKKWFDSARLARVLHRSRPGLAGRSMKTEPSAWTCIPRRIRSISRDCRLATTVASVKVGDQDVTEQGILVGNADVSDVLITLNAPRHLAVVKGKITGLPADRFASTGVVLTGPTFNRGQADVQQDGTFQFDAVVPGLYKLTLNGVPEFAPMTVVVDGFGTFEVNVAVTGQ